MPETGTTHPLCDFCRERGRVRRGEHEVNGEWMCGPCFRGEGTAQERLGEEGWERDFYPKSYERRRAIKRQATQRYHERHRKEHRAYMREYHRLKKAEAPTAETQRRREGSEINSPRLSASAVNRPPTAEAPRAL